MWPAVAVNDDMERQGALPWAWLAANVGEHFPQEAFDVSFFKKTDTILALVLDIERSPDEEAVLLPLRSAC